MVSLPISSQATNYSQMALKVEYERQREEYESALRALHGC
jgi:hypothetical protein